MNNDQDFETYLFISHTKLIIRVNDNLNQKIYEKESLFDQDEYEINFIKLDYFLNDNIFKIEKKLNDFVNKIFVVLDLDIFSPIEISIKNHSFKDLSDYKNFNHLLSEANECCSNTIKEKKIVHMFIQNYWRDNQSHSLLSRHELKKVFSIDIKFICLSNEIIRKLEQVLKKYHISVSRLVNANYVKNFLLKEEINDHDIFLMSNKILNGHNPNEVMILNKTSKNDGFFVKFFDFFS
tara:strand:+ start:464 stop:1174 length:711 start_codon:yes stop_codon:yes gene_type:complete